ncbi:hypothetical protein Z517_06830 [Fonsecaea pedrosoi CBS 271.37]|uniref:Unplaced genomic scaffold supercont1.4, whole genome shotgun sequence n=1 Tax=Fonsecaea pedrosoi CBS 271.37 TaxID=1442368 RepID=A0A0D2GNR0_9EURO|nr:uncharacterized protein Z517_06830 [Fonsecaea pedrosoi CBS 271.37]KIW80215.1 hypothetical protein Z517_06830 [Fonsecaea pedrosoi CBS 271.37]
MAPIREGRVAPGVAFVTGGARGLGNAVAMSFAKEGASAVAIVDWASEEPMAKAKAGIESFGTKCITIYADVTKEDEIRGAVEKAAATFGRIDYAANFAGVAVKEGLTWEMPYETWRKVINVNQDGVWLSMKYELAQMVKQTPIEFEDGREKARGAIVNCASIGSIQAGARSTGYASSKHAVAGFTKAAALEARQFGIRVNAVSPGFLRTHLLDDVVGDAQQSTGNDFFTQNEARQGRRADFSEIGDATVLLCNPRMSLVNGHNLVVDGGFTINATNY